MNYLCLRLRNESGTMTELQHNRNLTPRPLPLMIGEGAAYAGKKWNRTSPTTSSGWITVQDSMTRQEDSLRLILQAKILEQKGLIMDSKLTKMKKNIFIILILNIIIGCSGKSRPEKSRDMCDINDIYYSYASNTAERNRDLIFNTESCEKAKVLSDSSSTPPLYFEIKQAELLLAKK